MYKVFQEKSLDETMWHIKKRIENFNLSMINEDGYKKLRELYNRQKNPLDLFVLTAFSFNHQIRFNNNHEFNNPFGRERSCFNNTMKENLEYFIIRLKEENISFINCYFDQFDFSFLTSKDFVYCDPPYLITTGTYNDGKRGFGGWTEKEERILLTILDNLDSRNIKFGLSNVLEHKGKSNEILKDWLRKNPKYKINYLYNHYSNSNYQTFVRDKNASIEVLIANYEPQKTRKENFLFDDINFYYS